MLQSFGTELDTRLPGLSLPASVQTSLEHERNKLAGADLSGVPPELRATVQGAIDESFVHGFRRVALVGAALALASSLAAGWLVDSKRTAQPHA